MTSPRSTGSPPTRRGTSTWGIRWRCCPSPDGTSRTVLLGPDVLGGQHLQYTVPARTWMGARVATATGWSFFGCTMAPGFTYEGYEHGDAAELTASHPDRAARIAALSRP